MLTAERAYQQRGPTSREGLPAERAYQHNEKAMACVLLK